ncbi:hypothetical protein CPB86DRAFT_321278 [Serendipita vermifera]|nr:hypothetical protein CPB86DRAFT_321278 [Serendipita vermifera]
MVTYTTSPVVISIIDGHSCRICHIRETTVFPSSGCDSSSVHVSIILEMAWYHKSSKFCRLFWPLRKPGSGLMVSCRQSAVCHMDQHAIFFKNFACTFMISFTFSGYPWLDSFQIYTLY